MESSGWLGGEGRRGDEMKEWWVVVKGLDAKAKAARCVQSPVYEGGGVSSLFSRRTENVACSE